MERYSGEEIVNVGTGEDVTIAELAALIREVVGYRGRLSFDATKPDGTPRKLLNVARLHALGFRATTSLREGLERTYGWFVAGTLTATCALSAARQTRLRLRLGLRRRAVAANPTMPDSSNHTAGGSGTPATYIEYVSPDPVTDTS